MFRRLASQVSLMLSALLIAIPGPVVALPSQAPPPPQPARIVAIGDLHGDCSAWRDIALGAGLIDASNRWTGGRTIFVQTGDVTDRGPDSLKIIKDLRRLQREAARAGGRVVTLVGNHEAMQVTGDLRYVHPGEYAAFADKDSARRRDALYAANRAAIETAARARDPKLSKEAIREAWLKETPLGMIEHQLAWRPAGELGKWTIGNPAVVMIGDSLFVHGGISAGYVNIPLAEINRRVAAALAAREIGPESIINDQNGPLWYRGLLTRAKGADDAPAAPAAGTAVPAPAPAPRPSIEAEVDMVLKAHGAKRIVIGHTPTLKGISLLQGGKLVRIDTGISQHYGGTLSWLEIAGNQATPRTVPRSGTRCSK